MSKQASRHSLRHSLNRQRIADGSCVLGFALAVFCGAIIIAGAASVSHAGILSKLLREAGEAGTKASKHGIGALDNAGAALRKLPDADAKTALAVHATPEGHWVFVNKKGDQFTAGTPDELARAPQSLLGVSANETPLSLFLTDKTVFEHSSRLRDLPSTAKLHVTMDNKTHRLIASPDQPKGYVLRATSNVDVALTRKEMVQEAMYRLARPLNRANIRVLSLQPGGPKTLSSVRAYDPKTKQRLTEAVDPQHLGPAMRKLKGQTVIVTGKVKNGVLEFQPDAMPASQISMADLASAARNADVNLIVLRSSSPNQPGGKTWLWRTIEVDGLKEALEKPTFADFMQGIAERSGNVLVEANQGGQGRLVISARPTARAANPGIATDVGSWLDTISETVTGTIATEGMSAFVRNKDREREHALRVIPGIPSIAQIMYAFGIFAGLMGLGTARSWWRSIWPPENRSEYAGTFGFWAARIVRGAAFVLLFLPLFGIPAVIWSVLRPLLRIIWAPFRFVGS